MKHLITHQAYKAKHHLATLISQSHQFLNRNWMKLLVIMFAFNIILSKNIHLEVDLNNAQAAIYQGGMHHQSQNQVLPVSNQSSLAPKANSLSNLGFILNPIHTERKQTPERTVEYYNDKCKNYIQKHKHIAIQEMKNTGVPASIKLAQALLESNAGESKLAAKSNNHFGIKCFSKKCKKGHCTNFSDDSHKDFFVNYKTIQSSFYAHSLFLKKQRYTHLFKLPKGDYKSWAEGLQKAGYATDPNYSKKLIRIIESMKLNQYD